MLMRRIDELHLEYPFAGSRMLRDMLARQELEVGRRHVKTLMRKMSIEAIYRRPNTSKPAPGHRIYPYLLRGLAITRPNQVWAMDIIYIPMARGFVYPAVVVDWFSRRVLAWRVSITMDASFCIEALEEALSRNEKPEIFNTDQGSQFTSDAFTGRLKEHGIRISMDGRERWRDNVFVERIWRSIKYEEVYLHAYSSVSEARAHRQIHRVLQLDSPTLQPEGALARSGILQPPASSPGSLNQRTELPPKKQQNLFKQPGPPHFTEPAPTPYARRYGSQCRCMCWSQSSAGDSNFAPVSTKSYRS